MCVRVWFVVLLTAAVVSGQTTPYRKTLDRVAAIRAEMAAGYARADSTARDSIVETARTYVRTVLVESIFPTWYGTPWDFNGTTQIPGSGVIACGYFVTTTLRDAGFTLPRIRWAQLAAEDIVKQLSPTRDIWRRSNTPIDSVTAHISRNGPGVYVVGLDCHVGFIVNHNDSLRFVHSSYYHPEIGVMSEPLDSPNPLRDSRYRVIGRILGDEMMVWWLTGRRVTSDEGDGGE